MGYKLRSPITKTPQTVAKSGSVPVTVQLNGLNYWDNVSKKLLQSLFSSIARIDLTTVTGQTQSYMKCAPVSAIIGRIAEYSMNGRYAFVDDNGKELTTVNNQINKIFARPNFMQTWEEFIAAAVTYVKLNGQCYILPIVPFGMDVTHATAIFVIPNWAVTPEYTGRTIYQGEIKGMVKQYRISFLSEPIPAERMLVIRDSSPAVTTETQKIFEGQSRLYSLGDQINNLIAIQDAFYTITTKRGALGAWVPENSKDGMGALMPIDPKDKQDVIDSFLSYGINSNQHAPFQVLGIGMKWVQAAMNTTELKLFEGNEAGIIAVAMAMNVSTSIIGIKDVKYDNQSAAEKAAYQSAVIPCVNNILQNLSSFFKCDGFSLKSFWDHLEVFQKAKKEEADALNAMTSALDKPYKSRVIGMKEYRVLIANFMPVGSQFDPEAMPADLYEGQPTQTIVTQ